VEVGQEARPPSGHWPAAVDTPASTRSTTHGLRRSLELLRVLTESDLRFRYGRGPWRFLRWLLEPVALVGVYLILVTFVLDRPGTAVGLSLTCAVIAFQLIMLTVGNAMTALDARRPILLNMSFKRMLLPISSALSEGAAFGASLLLVAFMMIVYRVAPTWNVAWLPLVVFVNLVLAVAAAYPAILFGIWLRELKPFVLSFVRVLFFLSPSLVPLAEARQGTQQLLRLNPLTGLFEAYRAIFFYGRPIEAWQLLYPLAAAVILLVAFVPIYRSEQRHFAKVI
jgi:lipopolysaccharide transport system permease protein